MRDRASIYIYNEKHVHSADVQVGSKGAGLKQPLSESCVKEPVSESGGSRKENSACLNTCSVLGMAATDSGNRQRLGYRLLNTCSVLGTEANGSDSDYFET